MMSSSNHPTSNIGDAFSSNFLDYTTASPNYFPASPKNISPDPLDNLSKYLLASLAVSSFHDMQAYNVVANKPPIPPQDPITPPTILTPSLNTNDAAFGGKKPEFKGKKPESKVYVSPSSSAQTKKHDDKTKREAKVPAIGQISTNSTNTFSVASPSNTALTYFNDKEDVGAEADFTNLETNITVSLIPTTRVHKDHHVTYIIGDLSSATQTRNMTRVLQDQGGLTQINNEDFHTCMFACFLSQEEPKREEGIDYEEVFAPLARIEAIQLFLAYASFMRFMVYQMDVKSAFLYGTIEEEVCVCQPPGFEEPDHPDKVYKVVKTVS
nr:putative ribonuclease H-like domain-containing protein [Tanacetum cinerariifolium]